MDGEPPTQRKQRILFKLHGSHWQFKAGPHFTFRFHWVKLKHRATIFFAPRSHFPIQKIPSQGCTPVWLPVTKGVSQRESNVPTSGNMCWHALLWCHRCMPSTFHAIPSLLQGEIFSVHTWKDNKSMIFQATSKNPHLQQWEVSEKIANRHIWRAWGTIKQLNRFAPGIQTNENSNCAPAVIRIFLGTFRVYRHPQAKICVYIYINRYFTCLYQFWTLIFCMYKPDKGEECRGQRSWYQW